MSKKKMMVGGKPKPYPPNRTNYTEYWKSKQNLYVNEKKVVRIVLGGKKDD